MNLPHINMISQQEFCAHIEDDDFLRKYGNPVAVQGEDGSILICMNHMDLRNEKRILAFSRTDTKTNSLFIFKEYGIGKRVPKETLDPLMKAAKLDRYCYISYVEKDAFSEVINHNLNQNDPTRGTGVYSLQQFFELFFNKEEYTKFKKYALLFSDKVKDYFGFTIIRTLKPNSVLSFRKSVLNIIKTLDTNDLGVNSHISSSQKEILDRHFFGNRNCEILLGSSDFAQSFLTSEWLFDSLSNAGNIDLTPIAMGYFKAIEQFLFSYISLHTHEKDGYSRSVFVGKQRSFADSNGNADLTDALINDREKNKYLTLGSLTGFFGHVDLRTRVYWRRNQDLLENRIDQATYDFIIESLSRINSLRNGYFHKDNLREWDKVKEARKTALLVFYLILGAYKLSETEKGHLGLIQVEDHDDYYRLCAYINSKAYGGTDYLVHPVFFVNDANDFFIPDPDNYIEYDIYGEPIFSGVYLQEFENKNKVLKITREHLPSQIYEDALVISRSIPITIQVAGKKKLIFCDGRFLADNE